MLTGAAKYYWLAPRMIAMARQQSNGSSYDGRDLPAMISLDGPAYCTGDAVGPLRPVLIGAVAAARPAGTPDARQPVVQGRSFSGSVLPNVLDPVAREVERHHHHGDAVLLSRQAGMTVTYAPGSSKLAASATSTKKLATARRLRSGVARPDEAAAIADRRGVGSRRPMRA